MNLTQEQALASLVAWLGNKTAGTFDNLPPDSANPIDNRRLVLPSQLAGKTALFVEHISDDDTWTGTVVQKTEMEVWIWIFASPGDDDVPSTVLNGLCAQVRNALAPDGMGNPCTLGGLVHYARVEGKSEYFPGDIGKQALARIQVAILLP
ncbi:MAG TPA: hypothetical protein VKR31_00830 [Rhizomicrobium sp.]|nr:hypothetical protein [Rhizomicrobium sp.]